MSTQGESTSAPSRRVLVVDDNQDSVDSMVMLLELLGNQVLTARDGIEAVEAADRFLAGPGPHGHGDASHERIRCDSPHSRAALGPEMMSSR